jgi:hypothetical protein
MIPRRTVLEGAAAALIVPADREISSFIVMRSEKNDLSRPA